MFSGGHSGGVTPVPIPNTEVKPASADGTWGVAPWESRTSPESFCIRALHRYGAGLVYVTARPDAMRRATSMAAIAIAIVNHTCRPRRAAAFVPYPSMQATATTPYRSVLLGCPSPNAYAIVASASSPTAPTTEVRGPRRWGRPLTPEVRSASMSGRRWPGVHQRRGSQCRRATMPVPGRSPGCQPLSLRRGAGRRHNTARRRAE